MGSKDLLFLNPAYNHVCVRFLLILKDHQEGMAAICGRNTRGKGLFTACMLFVVIWRAYHLIIYNVPLLQSCGLLGI